MLFHFLFPFVLSVSAQLNGLTVSTQQGPVSGTFSSPNVRQFLGIPYATAGRWEAPRLPAHRKEIFKATAFGDSCVQNLTPASTEFLVLANNLGLGTTESEDCLTINIWSPSVQRKQKTAVLLWIYGGSTVIGTSNSTIYVGNNFVRDNDDITIVSFNYRLNIFGQPNSPQLVSKTTSQNFGLLDLDAAITWVHDNIANFGGDPERITIFGQSAGAASADQYAFAHPQDTKVKGIILQSGYATILNSPNASTTLDPTPWNTVAQAVGCGTVNNGAQFRCMQAVPFRKLEDAVIRTNAVFNRVIDNINMFPDTNARAAAGKFLKVPLLTGSTSDEFDIFLLAQTRVTGGVSTPTITEMLSDVITLTTFTCPTGSNAMSRLINGVPVWRYVYQGVFPDISSTPGLRAYHTAEIPLVFGTYNSTTIPATQAEIALSKFMQGAWVAFARDPKRGLVNFGWPLYNPNTTTLAQLGNPTNESGMVLTRGALVDSACSSPGVLANIEAQLTGLLVN